METTSVVIVTHQSGPFIGSVLDALAKDERGPDEVIVVDSASSDDTRSILAEHRVRTILLEDNVGFAEGTHIGAEAATGSILVFLGHDTTPEPGWLTALTEAVGLDGVGAAMATVVDADHPDRFNTSGGHLTFVGLAWLSGLGDPVPVDEPDLIEVAFPSGAAMAIGAETWARFGGFRRSLFMYLEDTDLGWRMRLAGLRVVRSSRSRVRHVYDFSRTPAKMYYLERNRWVLVCTNYRAATLVVLFPALVLADLGVWFVAIRDGWAKQKMRANIDAFRTRKEWRHDRALVDSNRVIGDADMLATLDGGVSTVRQIDAPRGSRTVDAVLGGYLRLAIRVVRFLERST